MSVEVIFPSAGHHLKDSGAFYNGRKESDEMMCFRDLVIKELNIKNHKNIPDNDLETATQHQARIKTGVGSVVCEFHLNASANLTATGTEAIISKNASANSKQMAIELTTATEKILGIKNRGVKTDAETPRGRIGIVNKPGTTALLEICFISNKNDMKSFDLNKETLAKEVAKILIKFDNLI